MNINTRIRLAITSIRESRIEIEKLKKENADLINRMQTMSCIYRSRMDEQRSELQILRGQVDRIQPTMERFIGLLQSKFETMVERTKKSLDDVRYQKKLLGSQLDVKKLKFIHLSKRASTLEKQLTKLKRINSRLISGDKAGALTLRCMRCKARKNVIKSLEQELVGAISSKDSFDARVNAAIKEKTESESRQDELNAELVKMRDEMTNLRRNNTALEQELRDERRKVLALEKQSPETSSQRQTPFVEVARTPTDQLQFLLQNHHSQLPQSNPGPAFDFSSQIHARCKQFISKLEGQLQRKQTECAHQADANQNALRTQLEFFQRRCEEMSLDLERRSLAYNQQQAELERANQQKDQLQNMLNNLYAGMVGLVTAAMPE